MRKFLLILLIFIYKNSFSQLNDNFSDGNFTANPTWTGTDSETNFIIIDGQLRSNSTQINSNFYLSTPNSLATDCIWEFDLNLQFSTSSTNYVDVYLISNTADLKSTNINGYFVRIGNTDDEISLYKRSGATSTNSKIIDGTNAVVNGSSNNPFRIKITRTNTGVFILEYDKSQTGNNYVVEGSATDNAFTTTSHFGIFIQQSTATFVQKHFFDNFSIRLKPVDNMPPQLVSTALEPTKITLTFDETVDKTEAEKPVNYIVNPGNIVPSSVTASGKTVVLNFSGSFVDGNYNISISNIKDLSGNINPAITKNISFITPAIASKNDILINEVLFNASGDEEFIELYNNTNKTFDFKNLLIASANTNEINTLPTKSTVKAISTASALFLPGSYWVIAKNPEAVKLKYSTFSSDNFIAVSSISTLTNEKGSVFILKQDSSIIDELNYSEKMHFPLLKEVKGVSLERRYFNELTNKPGNFGSAAASVGFATPGYKNSQYLVPVETEEVISFSSKTFSPDNDGFEDILTINYNLNATGYVANITIYDDNGRLVKKLVSNETIASTGTWLWYGLNFNSGKAKTGIYIVYAEFFNLGGEVKKFKKAVTLASKF